VVTMAGAIDAHSRWAHFVVALITVLLGFVTAWSWPGLVKDAPTAFGTIGFFVTLYGVVFAIIEVLRLKAAAELAMKAAKKAARRIEALYDARNSAECQTLIENVLNRLDEDGTLSASSLGRIVKLYAAEFSTTYELETSPHRTRVATVNSFAFAQRGSKLSRITSCDNLKAALVNMVEDLSASNGRRIQEESSR
jgi:hypothetical protein